MLIWVVSLAKCLLPSHLTVSKHSRSPTCSNWSKRAVRKDLRATVQAFLFFLGTLFEENFPEHVLLLLMSIVILDIVVVRLVENTIRVVVAVRIFVPNPTSLRHGGVRVDATDSLYSCLHWILILVVLARYKKYSLMEATDDRNLRRLLYLIFWLFISF